MWCGVVWCGVVWVGAMVWVGGWMVGWGVVGENTGTGVAMPTDGSGGCEVERADKAGCQAGAD